MSTIGAESRHTGLTAALLALGGIEQALAALERARVVAVLDGSGMGWRCLPRIDGVTECHVRMVNPAVFLGRTADEARSKAAAWVEKEGKARGNRCPHQIPEQCNASCLEPEAGEV